MSMKEEQHYSKGGGWNSMSELHPDFCFKRIYYARGLAWYQCKKKVKTEVEGKKYCAIHSPEAEKSRRKKQDEKFEKREKYMKEMAIISAIELLEKKGLLLKGQITYQFTPQ